MAAIRVMTPNPGLSVVPVAAIQESIRHLADDRPPEAVLFGKAFLVNSLQFVKVVFDQAIKRGGFGISRKIDGCDSFRHNPPNGRTGDIYGEAEAVRLAIKAREEAIENILGIKGPAQEWGKLPLDKLVEVVENAQSPYEKGRALKELIYVLFEGVPGFSVNDTNVTTETEEIDLVILNGSEDPRFSQMQFC